MKVIGLTGSAGSGKDTSCGFALAWCEAHGIDAERVALADPLKVSAARALGFQGARALGSPEETAECVAFCNDIKKPDVTLRVERYIPPDCGPEAVPPEYVPLAEITGRQFLQFYGTESHRDVFGESFWTDVTKDIIDQKEREGVDVVFVTDVRFDDEARFILSEDDWDSEVWRVHRDATEISSGAEGHLSESGILSDFVALLVTNDGTLDDLREAIYLACEVQLKEVK